MSVRVAVIQNDAAILNLHIAAIAASPEYVLAGSAQTGAAGVALIRRGLADIYLIDLDLQDMGGNDLIKYALKTDPGAQVMAITAALDSDNIIAGVQAGATAFMLKQSPASELIESLHNVRDGGSHLSPAIASIILRILRCKKTAPAEPAAEIFPVLTERENQVLHMLSNGLSFKEIGGALSISVHTVAHHNRSLYTKLEVRSRAAAVYEATRRGLI